MSSFCCFLCNQNITFIFYDKRVQIKAMEMLEFPTQEAGCYISKNGLLIVAHPCPQFSGLLTM